MNQLISISTTDDIPPEYRDTTIGLLLEYHNLNHAPENYEQARLLIGMCMDNRKRLLIPDNFAYIIRTGGGNLQFSEFHVSYAIAVGGVRSIALIGHSDCGMVKPIARKEQFVQGLVLGAGWEESKAEELFMHSAARFDIGNEIDFVSNEAKRMRLRYPGIEIVPLLYRVEDHLLYLIRES